MNDHYFTDSPAATDDELRLLRVHARARDLQMWVSDNVFSSSRLDPGTAQLLRALPEMPKSGTFLDLGCGWGPIAVSLALESPAASVWAVDVNPRALQLTETNAQMNGAGNVRCEEEGFAYSHAVEHSVRFDRIVSNPPVRIGKKAVRELLSKWLKLLAPGGEAWLVMSKNLGGDPLITWLGEQGYTAVKVASRKGFRIIKATGE